MMNTFEAAQCYHRQTDRQTDRQAQYHCIRHTHRHRLTERLMQCHVYSLPELGRSSTRWLSHSNTSCVFLTSSSSGSSASTSLQVQHTLQSLPFSHCLPALSRSLTILQLSNGRQHNSSLQETIKKPDQQTHFSSKFLHLCEVNHSLFGSRSRL